MLTLAGGLAEENRSTLSDCFNNKDPRHDRIARKMAKELDLIACDIL